MSQPLDELNKIVTTADIPLEDQNDILVVLPALPEEAIQTLNDIFKKNPEAVKDFNKSFKAKVRAITNEDDKEWEEIMTNEREEIESIEKARDAELAALDGNNDDPYANSDKYDDNNNY